MIEILLMALLLTFLFFCLVFVASLLIILYLKPNYFKNKGFFGIIKAVLDVMYEAELREETS